MIYATQEKMCCLPRLLPLIACIVDGKISQLLDNFSLLTKIKDVPII